MPSEMAATSPDAPSATSAHLYGGRNIQLPSPVSPSTQPSPVSISPFTPAASISPESGRSNHHLIPVRGFVHEVLRRSRISTGVLQTALCYLEAVRGKVPDLLLKEQAKASPDYVEVEEDPSSRIVMGSAADFEQDQAMFEELIAHAADPAACVNLGSDFMDTQDTIGYQSYNGPPTAPPTEPLNFLDATDCVPPVQSSSSKKPSPPLPPLPPQPSPLLCPRRTFLACLILASKFMQDRSYSNRAWAKLAGLPPREIGRCERALGEALEWRLWVGKGPAPASALAPGVGAHRAVTRCRSEATLQSSPSWIAPVVPTSGTAMYLTHSTPDGRLANKSAGLRRSSTMPTIGANGPAATQSFTSNAIFASTYAVPSTLSGDRNTFADATSRLANIPSSGAAASWFGANMQQPSPSLCTPTLSYSPASTASSEECERTVQMSGGMDMPEGAFEFGGKLSGLREELFFCEGQHPDLKLPALRHAEPMVVRGPVRLPSISEAVPNPALIERVLEPLPLPGAAHHDSLGPEFNNIFATWSVLDRSH